MKNGKILFIVNDKGSWIDRDRDLLSADFQVSELVLAPRSYNYFTVSLLLKVLKTDILFFWFGSLQFLPLALLGKILGKKVLIVAGGYDVAKGELIGHGAFCESSFKKYLRTLLFKIADKVLAVSKSNRQEAIVNAHIPESKLELVYLGFESQTEPLIPWQERPQKVVMLAAAGVSTFKLKGIEHFLEIARMTPEYEFVLMGTYDDCLVKYLEVNPVTNLKLTGFVPFGSEAFKKELHTSRFVFQLSYYESFGAAVVDAGLFGCYPVVFSQYSLVEVVEGIGKCFPFGERVAISQFLRNEGMNLKVDEKSIRDAFETRFPMKRRRELLVKTVASLA